jgi:hypothetical protein
MPSSLYDQYRSTQDALDLEFERRLRQHGDNDFRDVLALAGELARLYYAREHEANLTPVG